MPTYNFQVNGEPVSVDAPADLALLWVLRDKLGITGPKYGCGVNVCKACTCLVNNRAVQTCVTPVSSVAGKRVTTIEGLADGDTLHPVQQAWLELDVPQCGFCQPGQIMNAVALLRAKRNPTDADIDAIENMGRCGTYGRSRQAIKNAAAAMLSARGRREKGPPAKPLDRPDLGYASKLDRRADLVCSRGRGGREDSSSRRCGAMERLTCSSSPSNSWRSSRPSSLGPR